MTGWELIAAAAAGWTVLSVLIGLFVARCMSLAEPGTGGSTETAPLGMGAAGTPPPGPAAPVLDLQTYRRTRRTA